jgi:hypothetical protein
VDARGIVQALPLGVFLVAVGFALAMAGGCVAAARHASSRARFAGALETTPVASAPEGYVALEGAVEAIDGRALEAPLTGARCVWYRARVETWVDRPAESRRLPALPWKTIRERTSLAPFLLRDGSGVCVVLPHGAEVTPTNRSIWTGPTIDPVERNPPRLGPTESPQGMVRSGGGRSARFRYTEERIFAGDPLFVTGRLGRRGAGQNECDRVPSEDAAGDAPADREAEADLAARAATITDRWLRRDPDGRPFLLSTTRRETHVYLNELGAKAALRVALVPLGLAALLVLFRWA